MMLMSSPASQFGVPSTLPSPLRKVRDWQRSLMVPSENWTRRLIVFEIALVSSSSILKALLTISADSSGLASRNSLALDHRLHDSQRRVTIRQQAA